jgi:hypothetical protein
LEIRRIEDFVREIVKLAGPQRAGDCPAASMACVDAAGDVQQLLAAQRFESAPPLVGAPQQRHVRWMLEIGEPDDAIDAMRRSAIVRDVELLEAEHAQAAARQLIYGSAAHAADADDDGIVAPAGGIRESGLGIRGAWGSS